MDSTNKQQDSTVKTKSTGKKVGSIIGNILIWLFIAFSVVITIFAFSAQSNSDGVPTIAGKVISPVLSPSMEPTIKKGDIIISRKLGDNAGNDEKTTLAVGDIISFKADLNGDNTPEINTHRIIERIEENGRVSYRTKGDNNEYQDNYTVASTEVISKYEGTRIALLGNVIEFLMQPTGFFICIVIPLILFFLFEIIMFVRKVIEVKNAGKKQITAEDEEMIKRKAVEEFLRKQEEENKKSEADNADSSGTSDVSGDE